MKAQGTFQESSGTSLLWLSSRTPVKPQAPDLAVTQQLVQTTLSRLTQRVVVLGRGVR